MTRTSALEVGQQRNASPTWRFVDHLIGEIAHHVGVDARRSPGTAASALALAVGSRPSRSSRAIADDGRQRGGRGRQYRPPGAPVKSCYDQPGGSLTTLHLDLLIRVACNYRDRRDAKPAPQIRHGDAIQRRRLVIRGCGPGGRHGPHSWGGPGAVNPRRRGAPARDGSRLTHGSLPAGGDPRQNRPSPEARH